MNLSASAAAQKASEPVRGCEKAEFIPMPNPRASSTPQRTRSWKLALAACSLALGCTATSPPAEKSAADPSLQQYALDKLPDTVENTAYVDFGGKVQLLGYNVVPAETAPPESNISLTLYWQRTGSLDDGWGLFTHILDEHGRQLAQHDSSGPLRAEKPGGGQALGPSAWELGKVYVDETQFQVPKTVQLGSEAAPLNTEVITLAVGVWKDSARLDVIGGRADRFKRFLVTDLKTGIERQPTAEEKEESDDAEEATEKGSDG